MTLAQLARKRYSPMSADVADAAMGMLRGGEYQRLSRLLAHLGVDGGIERVIDCAVAQAINGASDARLRAAAEYVDPWHYSETLNLHIVGAIISRMGDVEDSNGGER